MWLIHRELLELKEHKAHFVLLLSDIMCEEP